MEQVEDVGLGRHLCLEGEFDGVEYDLFVMLQHQGKNLDHVSVAAGMLEQIQGVMRQHLSALVLPPRMA